MGPTQYSEIGEYARESADSKSPFQVFVLAPKGLDPVRIARAALRAGGACIIPFTEENTEIHADLAACELPHGGGVIAAVESADFCAAFASNPPAWLRGVVASPEILSAASGAIDQLRNRRIDVYCEVIRWRDDLRTLEDRISGFILKGHECGGIVSEQTTYLLLQEFRKRTTVPLFARGGITPESAAASSVAGASGVVLDDQILLLAESPLGDARVRRRLKGMSGAETVQVEDPRGGRYLRGLDKPGGSFAEALSKKLVEDPDAMEMVAMGLSWESGSVAPAGQGLALAAPMAKRYRTIGRFITAVQTAVRALPAAAAKRRALAKGGALAKTLGTEYPILQGPMTRVSDVAPFLYNVGCGGALPFAALAVLKKPQAETLLRETKALMGDRPWGAGILGFASPDILKPQFEALERTPPNYMLIAGGRVHQALDFEKKGVPAFLHASTASLIAHYLDEGARRFIIEGRECGGHIGPLTSFTLWSSIVEALRNHPVVESKGASIQIVFAGGVHNALSAAMVATLAEPLAEKGVQIGVLMGTGYLFTKEIVESGAIVPDYQDVAVACGETRSLWEGPGFASRCAITPIAEEFSALKRNLEKSGASATQVRDELETYSLGRLRMATKGVARTGQDKRLTEIDEGQRHEQGMYMIGQVGALKSDIRTIAELHDDVADGSAALLEDFVKTRSSEIEFASTPARPADIAIVGMANLLPGADTLAAYWRRIISGESAITEVPEDRWSVDAYFSDDRSQRDKVYSRRGGFLNDIAFNPLDYGIPPASLSSVDPMQLLALELVSDALKDAHYGASDAWDRSQCSVVFGFSGGLGEVGAQYATRSELSRLYGDVPEDVLAKLPEWTEDSFAGVLPNVAAGRVANRFNFGGSNQTIDAACASSLAAVYSAVLELEAGCADMVVAGGIDTLQSPFGYLCFSKTQALSPRGVCNTFDQDADGIVISEGLAALVLKRLADAERDGDRIYAVIKGVGASSDGRAKGLTAPLPAGQRRALDRAYAQAGFSPATVQLMEAHGTGTVAGDKAELETVTGILKDAGAAPQSCAIGSVKTLIGHTKAAAGVSGLIKIALGLHHRVLPPHALVKNPNPAFDDEKSPLYLSQAPRPWTTTDEQPRRAGVSAFGFGGTNFHVTLEEYGDRDKPSAETDIGFDLLAFGFAASTREELAAQLVKTLSAIEQQRFKSLKDLALNVPAPGKDSSNRLAFSASSLDDAAKKITAAVAFLSGGAEKLPADIHFSDNPALLNGGKLAFVFPGQGSQYPDMMRQTALMDPNFIELLGRADDALAGTPSFSGKPALSRHIYPGDAFTPEARKRQMKSLTATEVAQPALGVIESGLFALLKSLGVAPDMTGGHSYGEFPALCAAGAIEFKDLIQLSEARGRAMVENGDPEKPGGMVAIAADAATVAEAVKAFDDIVVANINSPKQTVISGPKEAIDAAAAALSDAGLTANVVAVNQAFHSPLMHAARAQFEEALKAIPWRQPDIAVYSNTLGRRHDGDPDQLRAVMGEHLVSGVEFVKMAEAMAADGAAVFLEVGPRSVLSNRLSEIFDGDGPKVIAMDRSSRDAASVIDALAALFAEGCNVDFRALAEKSVEVAPRAALSKQKSGASWVLNGAYARKADAPKRDVRAPARNIAQPPIQPDAASATPAESLSSTLVEEMEFMEITEDMLRSGDEPSARPPDPLANYHQMMREFLRVQESVMLSYLGRNHAFPSPNKQVFSQPLSTNSAALSAPSTSAGARPAVGAAPAPLSNGLDVPAAPVNGSLSNGATPPAAAKANGVSHEAVEAAPSVSDATPAADANDISETNLISTFISVAAEKTGYPEDALDPDQVLEQDLGIDSIKRMEILGAVQKTLPPTAAEAMRADMDSVSQLPTIREIAGFVSSKLSSGSASHGGGAGEAEARPFDLAGEAEEPITVLPRFLQVPFEESIDHLPKRLPAGLRVIVTETSDGFHDDVMNAVKAAGGVGVLLAKDAYAEGDAERIRAATEAIVADGAPGGFIYLDSRRQLPDFDDLTVEDWRSFHKAGVKQFHVLLQSLAPYLREDGRIVAAMETGGLFGRSTESSEASQMSGGAGVLGVVKSLAHEWPTCSSKVIDLDGAVAADRRAQSLVEELAVLQGRREAGYPGGRRTILRTESAALTPPAEPPEMITSDWVVVATGGARGITAECMRTLAPYGPTLVLLGRSAPPEPEDPETSNLDVAGLRRFYMDASRAAGEKVRPVEIEAKVVRHLGLRDMRDTMADLAAMGAKIDYRSVDVLDRKGIEDLFADIYDQYGRVDMVVHGAGVIEDAVLEKKTPESFDRVFDTKVNSAFHIAKALRWDSLKGLCFFTSVAGRYGNRGQTDYAAANETLNRFAWMLKRGCGASAVIKAINWGPWDATMTGAGMVTEPVRQQFEARGIGVVKPKPGRDLFFKEMFWGAPEDVECVAWVADGESMEATACALPPPSDDDQLNDCILLRNGRRVGNGDRSIGWRFDLVNAPYVDDHRFDGVGVMPFAAVMQMLSEAPAAFDDHRHVIALEDLRMFKGITLKNGPVDIRITLKEELSDGRVRVVVNTEGDDRRPNYSGILRLADHLPKTPAALRPRLQRSQWTGASVHEMYRRWLSHGVRFQTLTEIQSIDESGVIALGAPSRPERFAPWSTNQAWSFDPGLIDGLLQTVWIWSRAVQDASTLPLHAKAVRRFDGDTSKGPLKIDVQILTEADDPDVLTAMRVFDGDGRLCYEIENFQGRTSPQLNRLSGGWQGGLRDYEQSLGVRA